MTDLTDRYAMHRARLYPPFQDLSPPYATIVADPPWRYQKDTTTGTKPGAAEGQYDTMSMRDIAALPVGDLTAPDAHLYLWVTAPRLYGDRGDRTFTPVDVMAAWGFDYVTTLVWHKTPGMGMGWYWRIDTEFVLFGTRGKAPISAEIRRSNLFAAARNGHSGKPASLMDAVEVVSPGPYVELFSRSPRLGWDSWGHGWCEPSDD